MTEQAIIPVAMPQDPKHWRYLYIETPSREIVVRVSPDMVHHSNGGIVALPMPANPDTYAAYAEALAVWLMEQERWGTDRLLKLVGEDGRAHFIRAVHILNVQVGPTEQAMHIQYL